MVPYNQAMCRVRLKPDLEENPGASVTPKVWRTCFLTDLQALVHCPHLHEARGRIAGGVGVEEVYQGI